ncbi:MAG TPA: hypothetical protein VLL27_09995 [Solirubrobacterales bacterium]|nr:hypothetical protein [Solirubrobacterales bacterium]
MKQKAETIDQRLVRALAHPLRIQILAAHLRSQDRITSGESRETVSTVIGMASFETAASLQDE